VLALKKIGVITEGDARLFNSFVHLSAVPENFVHIAKREDCYGQEFSAVILLGSGSLSDPGLYLLAQSRIKGRSP